MKPVPAVSATSYRKTLTINSGSEFTRKPYETEVSYVGRAEVKGCAGDTLLSKIVREIQPGPDLFPGCEKVCR